MQAPQMDPTTIHQQIANLSRSPFRDKVAQILECGPTDGAIVALAEKNPDRWGQLLAMLARLAGYTDKLEVEGSITHRIDGLSDAQLEAEIAAFKSIMDTTTTRQSPNSNESL